MVQTLEPADSLNHISQAQKPANSCSQMLRDPLFRPVGSKSAGGISQVKTDHFHLRELTLISAGQILKFAGRSSQVKTVNFHLRELTPTLASLRSLKLQNFHGTAVGSTFLKNVQRHCSQSHLFGLEATLEVPFCVPKVLKSLEKDIVLCKFPGVAHFDGIVTKKKRCWLSNLTDP